MVLKYIEPRDENLEIALLPPYASDLNPDEFVWNHMKSMAASKKPLKKRDSLMGRANKDLQSIKNNKMLVELFFLKKANGPGKMWRKSHSHNNHYLSHQKL